MKAYAMNEAALFDQSFDTKSGEFDKGQWSMRWVQQRWNGKASALETFSSQFWNTKNYHAMIRQF